MSKKILIPIDFNVESLNTLRRALDGQGDNQVEVVLLYAEYPPDSITELLFYSSTKRCKQLITPNFQEALNILKNRYERNIISISLEIFHGYGRPAFKNFVEGHRIDSIYIPKSYVLKPLKNGFNPIPIIKKTKHQYHEIDWEINQDDVYHQLSCLFN